MNCIACSIVMFRSIVSLRFTMAVKPGERHRRAGEKHRQQRLVRRGGDVASALSPVTKAICQIPFRGYSTATTRVYSISRSLNMKSVTCLTDEYTFRTSGRRVMTRSNCSPEEPPHAGRQELAKQVQRQQERAQEHRDDDVPRQERALDVDAR